MSPARTVFTAVALTALLACDPPLEPQITADISSPDFADGGGGRVVESVTGSGQSPAPDGQLRTFSVQTQKHVDGRVTGSFEFNNHGNSSHGTITCFTITGNQAWLGGAVLSSDNPALLGHDAVLRVVDNGEGKNGPADQISFLGIALDVESSLAQLWCDHTPEFLTLFDIEKGNIQIAEESPGETQRPPPSLGGGRLLVQ